VSHLLTGTRVDAVRAPAPTPRGRLSAWLLEHLVQAPHELVGPPQPDDDLLAGEDGPLALYLLYELHYRGLDGVDDAWEWHPGLLAVRAELEAGFDLALRDGLGPVEPPEDVADDLRRLLVDADGPSLGAWCEQHGELWHLREEAVHRSAYQLKEADPHSWALPRLAGRPKAALVEIQADEYGQGVEADMHAELFALHLERLGLDPDYGAYIDHIPGPTLTTVNLVSYVGLHRRLVGALVGHLALFEMASVPVMARFSAALRRHGLDAWTRLFFDTHVVADAHHQTVAATDLAGGLVSQQPWLAADVALGARALMLVEARRTARTLAAWEAGRSSLLRPLPVVDRVPGQDADEPPGQDPRTARG
jgi:hypothetical protein